MNPTPLPQDILVIDDNPSNLGLLSDLLQQRGYRVRVAKNGLRGLEVARIAKPDLIMLDISMPDMDGFEVCETLKADPGLSEVPVIFLSAHEGAGEKVRAFELGGADYVQKPFLVQEVLMRVQLQLRLASLQKELHAKNRSLEASNLRLQENAELLQQALMEAKALNRELINVNETLRQSEELQGRILAKMRSGISNPLGAIAGLADQALQREHDPEQIRSLCSRIKAETAYLDFQFRNIFAAADLEAGQAIPSITQVEIEGLLSKVLDAFSPAAKAKSVAIHKASGPEPGPLVFGTDAGMLRIIAANLVANAIEFSPAGATVRLSSRLEGGSLVLEIQDAGLGIQEADQASIFDRFRQLEAGPTPHHRGQGLGLPVTKALVELMNGTLELRSQPGQGAVFTCRFPPFVAMDASNTSSFEGKPFFFESPEEL